MMRRLFLFEVFLLLAADCAFAAVNPSSMFSDHMVLQRGKRVAVWGTAAPGEAVEVSFGGCTVETTASESGEWKVFLPSLKACAEGRDLTVSGSNTVVFRDVLVGDVWFAGGQSNMKFPVSKTDEKDAVISRADNPLIRLYAVPQRIAVRPQTRSGGQWMHSNAESIENFSAVAAIFAQRIHAETQIPIGIIECAVGSSSVECWVPESMLSREPFLPTWIHWKNYISNWEEERKKVIETSQRKLKRLEAQGKKGNRFLRRNSVNPPLPTETRTYPSGCYNGMLASVYPCSLTGFIWYQGEANRERGVQYRQLLPEMITHWRGLFGQGPLPFIQVQLPEIKTRDASEAGSATAELRESQYLTAKNMENVYMAVLIDSHQKGTIHPKNKNLPAERLARIALSTVYQQEVPCWSPAYVRMQPEGNAIRIYFDHLYGGLMTAKRKSGGSPEVDPAAEPVAHFMICGADRVFHEAKAEIEGDCVVVSSPQVPEPIHVRYAWADDPRGINLYNRAGLPVMPFRTDAFDEVSKGRTEPEIELVL